VGIFRYRFKNWGDWIVNLSGINWLSVLYWNYKFQITNFKNAPDWLIGWISGAMYN
jgi:hypothetical protein